MADIKKSIIYTAIPVTVLTTAGIVAKMLSKRDGTIKEELREATTDAFNDIDSAITDLKDNIEGKSASQLEKILDSAVEKAKERLDRMSSIIKTRLHESQLKR